MYIKLNSRVYTEEDFRGKTVSERDTVEYLFTTQEALEIWYRGLLSDSPGHPNADTYFKETFNIDI